MNLVCNHVADSGAADFSSEAKHAATARGGAVTFAEAESTHSLCKVVLISADFRRTADDSTIFFGFCISIRYQN